MGACRLASGMGLGIPLQKIAKELILRLGAGRSSLLQAGIGAQVITFAFEHDLCHPFVAPGAEINPAHTAGIGFVHGISTKHFDAGTVHIVEIFMGAAGASAAGGAAALQIGLAHIHFVAAIAAAMPDVKAFIFPGIGHNGEHTKPLSGQVFIGQAPPAAAALDVSGDETVAGGFHLIAAVAPAEPVGIAIPGPPAGFFLNRELAKAQARQVLPGRFRHGRTSTAVDNAGFKTAAFHKNFLAAVAPAAPHNGIANPLTGGFQHRQHSNAAASQICASHGDSP